MKFKITPFLALAGMLVSSPLFSARAADRLKKLEERLDRVEEKQQDMEVSFDQRKGRVKTFIADRVTLGGFFESGITGIFGPDTDTQASANNHVLGLNLTAELTDRFRFVNQTIVISSFTLQNPHNNPVHGFAGFPTKRDFGPFTFAAFVTQGYMEYVHSDLFKIQAGLGYVPFGTAFQQREPVLFLRRSGPQFLTTSDIAGNVGVSSAVWTGLHFSGETRVAEHHVGYNAYSITPLSDTGMVGGGSRFWWSTPDHMLTLGVSQQAADRGSDTYFSWGGDAKLSFHRFGLLTEYARQFLNGQDVSAFYAEPYVNFFEDRFVVFAEGDYLNFPKGVTSRGGVNVADPYEKWIYGGGINYLPIQAIRTRLTFLVHDYVGATATVAGQNRDYYALELSMGVAF
jgi:hypothetical protein